MIFRTLALSFRTVTVLAALVLLCGFEPGNGQLLEIPRGGNEHRNPTASHEDSSEAVPAGPDMQFHQLLKFYGCWKATVTRRDLTAFSDAAGHQPQEWTNRHYTICFARDMGGELQPTMSQTAAGRADIEDRGSSTELVGFDNHAVSLVSRYRFVDRSATRQKPRASWFFSRAPQPVDVEQVTQVSCLRESLDLVCTASAKAQCGETSCYSFSWTARFYAF